jgi:hypothetical protein
VLGVPIAGLIAWYEIIDLSRWRARRRLALKMKENDAYAEKVYGELGLSPTEGDAKVPEASPASPDVASEDQAEKSHIERLAQELKDSITSLLVEGRCAQEPVVVGIEAHSGAIRTFGVLYHRYRPRRFWWVMTFTNFPLCQLIVVNSLYEFRRNLYVPIREKMTEQAFRNRAQHALRVLRKKKKGDIMVDEEGNEVDTVNHHGDDINDEVIVEDDGMSAVVPASEVIVGDTQYASALYHYVPQNDELSLKAGDRVLVLEKLDDGWWRTRIEVQIKKV